jgi:hypothetical protein
MNKVGNLHKVGDSMPMGMRFNGRCNPTSHSVMVNAAMFHGLLGSIA